MALIAIISDTHFGVSNSNNMFLRYQDNYFRCLVDQLAKLGVSDLIHAGDLYDVRKSINFKTLRQTASFFRERMISAPFNIHIIVGNHDSYSKNTLKVNAPMELLDWTDFNIYQEPTEIDIDGETILMMPWICRDNEKISYKLMEDTFADVCIGHFDISGFGMSKEVVNKAGISRSIFKKFKHTFSGHFHLPSEQDNIIYVGSPYQLTWSDYGDTKRVILYDTKTHSLQYLENENNIFEKIQYTEGMGIDKNYTDKIIKIYTPEGYDAYKFDLFLRKLEEQHPFNISVIDSVPYGDSNTNVEDVMSKDTMTFLVETVDANTESTDEEKAELKELLFKLYTKAQELK